VPAAIRSISVSLSLPPATLSPNARPHWRAKAKAVRECRQTTYLSALVALARRPPPRWTFCRVEYQFQFADHRHRDLDNLIAAAKPVLDGLVDAGVLSDDSRADLECGRVYGAPRPALFVSVRPRRRRQPGESPTPAASKRPGNPRHDPSQEA
jgi:crossover junction endodeoxyribonuclease RusA